MMTKTLGDYFTLQRGNTYKSAQLGLPGPVLLGLGSIARNGGFREENLKTYGGVSDHRMLLGPGELYVSLKDVTQSADLLGAVARLPDHIGQGRLTQDTVKLVFKSADAPQTYIYWLLQSPDYRAYCKAHSTGTTNLGLAREDFLAFPVPELTQERAWIVALTQKIADKIVLNRRMNETLEGMAQAIFRDWFVDFGPVRRKLAGVTNPVEIMGGLTPDPALAARLAALFPSTLSDDRLPAGWRTDSLKEHVSNFDSKRVPVSSSERAKRPGPFPYYGAASAMGTIDGFIFDGVHLLVGEDGSVVRPGGLAVTQYVWGKFWVNNHAHVLQGRGSVTTEQLYLYFGCEPVEPYITGAVQMKLSQGRMGMMPFVYAGPATCEAFSELVAPLFGRVRAAADESRTLAETRDYLLPRLMSGALRVGATPVETAA